MHHLHPRSRTTSTLFTTTLAVSFLVVGLPHLLPCPVDRRQFADSVETSDGTVRRRRKRKDGDEAIKGEQVATIVRGSDGSRQETDEVGRRQRECPVPKPGGLVGKMMGFEHKEKDRPMQVVVQSFRDRNERQPFSTEDNNHAR